VAKGWTIPER